MKKTIFAVIAALVMVFAMTACGSSGPQSYAGFYSAIIPDGFTANEEQTEFRKDSDAHVGDRWQSANRAIREVCDLILKEKNNK